MKTFINIIAKARLAAIALVAVAALAACSDDDDNIVREGLTQNGITLTASTVSSLSFSWESVDNAVQYGYRLLDTDSTVVDGGVTTGTTASFSSLSDDTEYIFELTSFAEYNSGKYKNADAKFVNVKTEKIVPLDAPVLASEVKAEKVTVSWDAVENADKYYVEIVDSNDSIVNDTTTSTSYSFTGTVGLTYSVSVSADTEAEAYSQSEWATVSDLVPVKSDKVEIWRVTGSLNEPDITGTTMTKTLVAYDDGTYSLLDFVYDGSGYNLDFEVTSAGEMNITNGGTAVNGYIPVAYSDGYLAYIYAGSGYSSFNATEGKLWYYSYSNNGGYCNFTWNPEDVTVSWFVKGTLTESSGATTYTTGNGLSQVLIAYKDGSYKISNWLGNEGYDLNFTPQSDGSLTLTGDNYTDYGYCVGVPFYYDEQYGLYPLYLYNTSGNWGLEMDNDDCQFWISSYYYSSGYVQFKWNKADMISY